MIKKRDLTKLAKHMNDGVRRPISDIKLDEMLESYFCTDADLKVPLSRMGLSQIIIEKFRKKMASMGYKETVKLQGGNGKPQLVKFSPENMCYYASQQKAIVLRSEFV